MINLVEHTLFLADFKLQIFVNIPALIVAYDIFVLHCIGL